ncbi:uncharacterized protein LOC109282535 isoform X2 [Alligator mississippiensis]|uniref:uncharacterized protein LOC109282535 isoform X2 n=1 Tax=Alligator mississippiensis TaxID=8496 RepID=UPI00090740CC|nr:uncharacterized protein LOC109282535 isoform X2 [Alligator mississippiensis]
MPLQPVLRAPRPPRPSAAEAGRERKRKPCLCLHSRASCGAGPPGAAMAEQLLRLLQELDEEQFKCFKFFLRYSAPEPRIAWGPLENASRHQTADRLLEHYPHDTLGVALQMVRLIPRLDLVHSFQPPQDGAAPSQGNRGAANGPEQAPGPGRPRLVSQSQLMNLARCMGREWRQIGIQFLGLQNHQLDQLQEDHHGNLVMQAFGMLLEWRQKKGRAATAAHLHSILSAPDVALQPEALDCLLQS